MSDAIAVGADRSEFIRANTELLSPPLVPEVKLHLASEITGLWQMTEDELAARGLPPPYWAFAWAGGQALARYVLDNDACVRGRRVLDFGSGSGLVAIAAAIAGARRVTAAEVDDFAIAAIDLNARLNRVTIEVRAESPIGRSLAAHDVVLAGDICYERPLAEAAIAWLERAPSNGTDVLIGDPGRTYLPKDRLERLAEYRVENARALEDLDVRRTGVWCFRPVSCTGRGRRRRL